LDVYLNGCLIGSCTTGLVTMTNPARFNNDDYSCFVSVATPTNSVLPYVAVVSVNPTFPTSLAFASANFRIQSFNSFTALTNTGQSGQIQGRSRQYYQVAATNTNGPISVVVGLTIIDGPRLLLTAANTPNFMTSFQDQALPYSGWYQQKVCPFGLCTIEIPTFAAHPQVPVIYVWVTTVSTDITQWRSDEEKPTNYVINATTGTQNCVPASQATFGTFCSTLNITNAPGGVWNSRSGFDTLGLEANCIYNSLLCRCSTPTQPCLEALQEFSCLEPFVGCDNQGFKLPKCRTNCEYVVNECGPWLYTGAAGSSCDCQAPQFDCSSNYYVDGTTCSGSPQTSIVGSFDPIVDANTGNTLTAPQSISPDCNNGTLPSPSPFSTPSAFSTRTATPTPSPIHRVSAASSLSVSYLVVLLLALVWFV